MHDSMRYRFNAGECLLAALACQPHHRRLRLSMADSWLSLARQDEAMDELLASPNTAEPVKNEGLGGLAHGLPALEGLGHINNRVRV